MKVILSIEAGTASKAQAPKQAPMQAPSKAKAVAPKPPAITRTAAPAKVSLPVPKPPKPQAVVQSSNIAKIMAIIAEESGIAESDLTDNTAFADTGVDSLLGLTISARLKEELNTDVDFNALLFEAPTVGEIKAHFAGGSVTPDSSSAVLVMTPDYSTSPESARSEVMSLASSPPSTAGDPSEPQRKGAFGKVDFTRVLQIISEESGVSIEDFTPDTVFADAGVDSLLSLTIVARLKEELELDIQQDNILLEFPTVGELQTYFVGVEPAKESIKRAPTPKVEQPAPTVEISHPVPAVENTTKPKTSGTVGNADFTRVLQIISEESGVAMEDFTPDTVFADAGVDSLLSLTIVARLKEELELDIEQDNILLEYPTVAELEVALVGEQPQETSNPAPTPESTRSTKANTAYPQRTPEELASLVAREQAVDKLVAKYTAGYSGPTAPSGELPMPKENEKVVLVTGATGSLGSHLVWHMAQMPDVKTVVCINRKHRNEPYQRQIKAMRDKGIRFPDSLKHKLVCLQTDTAQPKLGFEPAEYDNLVNTVTHLIHNAWPMSGKRALEGFESQFQVMRNLADFAGDVASRRPQAFKFSFQMVSSIGVVGLYGKYGEKAGKKVHVPEERFGIDCILQNGYGDAKWGCERMIDETLHKHPDRFRAMAVRLGQIAGSKTSGYWNPMEHFGFVVKSSQTLGALPDVPGGELYWTPVNDMADTLIDLVLGDQTPYRFYHLENPNGQSWAEMNKILMDATGIQKMIPFDEWVKRVAEAPQRNNPAQTLIEFLDDNYLRMSYGGLVLDPAHTLEHSKSLRAVGPVSEKVARKYITVWKEIGFLSKAGSQITGFEP